MGSKWERKVIDMRQGSLLVTLPKDWCRFYNIKPGDMVEMTDEGKGLVIKPKKNET